MIDWKAVLVGLLFVAVLVAATYLRMSHGIGGLSQVTIVNRSAETLVETRLQQGDRQTRIDNIEPGRIRTADFIPRDGWFTLVVKYASGRSLSAANAGFLAADAPVIATFEVTNDKVALLSLSKRKSGLGKTR